MIRQSLCVLGLLAVALAGPALARDPLPIRAFAQLPRTADMSISPDGTKLATLSNVGGRYGITISSLTDKNAKPVVIAPPSNKYEVRWLRWANNEYILVGLGSLYRRFYLDDHSRETRLLSMTANGSKVVNMMKPLTQHKMGSLIPETVANLVAVNQDNVIDWSPEDPNTVLVSVQEDQFEDTSTAVRKIDVSSGAFKYEMKGKRGIYSYETDMTGAVRIGWGWGYAGELGKPYMSWRDPAGSWVDMKNTPLLGTDYQFIKLSRDPNFAYVLGPWNGRRALLWWDMKADKAKDAIVQNTSLDVENVFLDPDQRLLYAVELSDGSKQYLDDVWGKRMRMLAKTIPGMRLSVIGMSSASGRYLVKAEGSNEPGTYYLYDEPGKSLQIAEYAYAGIGPDTLAPRKWYRYRSRDGLDIEAVLTTPRDAPAGKALPTIVLPHGGPWAHDVLDFDWLAQFLADRGYLVLQPNFRGSTGYGQAHLDAGDRQWGKAMQDDLTDGLKQLVKDGLADPKRVCIVGGSYGGYAAMWGLVKDPD